MSPSLSADAYTLGSTDHDDRRPTSRCPDGSGGGGQDGAAAVLQKLQGVVGPSPVRNDVKLGGLGLPAAGDSPALTVTGSPSPPLLQEDKLSGPVAGGTSFVRLRQEGKLTLQHEVKLSGLGQMCLHSRRIQSGIKHSRLSSPWMPQVSLPLLAEVNRPYEKVLSVAGIKALKSSCSIVLLLLLTICVFGSSISQECPTPEVVGPSAVRNDVKLGGLGLPAAGDSPVLSVTGSPSPPLLQEDKLSGPAAGGTSFVRLRQEGKLTLRHEVKLSGLGQSRLYSQKIQSWMYSRLSTPWMAQVSLSQLAKVDRPYKKVLPVGYIKALESSYSIVLRLLLTIGGFGSLTLQKCPTPVICSRPNPVEEKVGRLQPPNSSSPLKTLDCWSVFSNNWKMENVQNIRPLSMTPLEKTSCMKPLKLHENRLNIKCQKM